MRNILEFVEMHLNELNDDELRDISYAMKLAAGRAKARKMKIERDLDVEYNLDVEWWPDPSFNGSFFIGWTKPFTADEQKLLQKADQIWCCTREELDSPDIRAGWRVSADGLQRIVNWGYKIRIRGYPLYRRGDHVIMQLKHIRRTLIYSKYGAKYKKKYKKTKGNHIK